MTLNVDFSLLKEAARKMGAKPLNISIKLKKRKDSVFKIRGLTDKGVVLESKNDLDVSNGFLGYKGMQVALYIQDHSYYFSKGKFDLVLKDGSEGNKFHLATCKKIKKMMNEGRFDRYVVAHRVNGIFYISGKNPDTGEARDGYAKLAVCKYCLEFLNYKKYYNLKVGSMERERIFKEFDVKEFFSTYSVFFERLPARYAGEISVDGYPEDWRSISNKKKKEKGWVCELCGVNLESQKHLLHVHHKNGVKTDNRYSNLQVLCVSCHKAQPTHGHLFITHQESKIILDLRKRQGLVKSQAWSEVYRFADAGLHGMIDLIEQDNVPVPDVGFDIANDHGEVVCTFELAWPKKNIAIAIADEDIEAGKEMGWKVWKIVEVLDGVNGFIKQFS